MIVKTTGPHVVLQSQPGPCRACGAATVAVLIATEAAPAREWLVMEPPITGAKCVHYTRHACEPVAPVQPVAPGLPVAPGQGRI